MVSKLGAVVVLDLDDTLYKEIEYLRSGFLQVVSCIESLYGKLALSNVDQLNRAMTEDWLGALCIELNLPNSIKESLLWIYRLHLPSISLGADIHQLLEGLSKKSHLAILTDGRSITQRQKIKALGLSHLPIYISEEYGATKPDTLGFELIMRDFPAEKYYYVGDNLIKDFLAPNSLGWTSVCLRDNGQNIHQQTIAGLSSSQLPEVWIDTLSDLLPHIC